MPDTWTWPLVPISERLFRCQAWRVVAHLKLADPKDVDPKLFATWLRQAREIELALSRR